MTVQAWLANLHRAGEVTPTTIAKAYRLLRRILNVAVEVGYLPRTPCTVKGAGSERAAEMRHASRSAWMACGCMTCGTRRPRWRLRPARPPRN
jgi:hypothetical protein